MLQAAKLVQYLGFFTGWLLPAAKLVQYLGFYTGWLLPAAKLVQYLGFYTGWLLPAAVIGLLVFLYGFFTMEQNVIAQEVCSDAAKK